MQYYITQIINGICQGSVYALMAIGYSVIVGMTNLVTFAFGEIIMIGAFSGYYVVTLLTNNLFAIIGASFIGALMNEPKMRTVQSLTIGGVTPDGEDASNRLSALCLDVTGSLKLPYPNLGVRIKQDVTPDWVYDMSLEVIKQGFGMPMLINDDAWIERLMELGYSIEYARDYYNMGCVEMMIQGKQCDWLAATGGFVSYPMVLEALLDDWRDGKIRFDTFDDFFVPHGMPAALPVVPQPRKL